MKSLLSIFTLALIILFTSCKKDTPPPVKSTPVPIKGLHGNGSSTKIGNVGCKLYSYSDGSSGGYLFTYDSGNHVTKVVKLDTNGNQTYQNIDFSWSGNQLLKVTYTETGYWSQYVNTYTGKYITSSKDSNNRNSLIYNYYYNYDSTGNLMYALQIQGKNIDSVAYHQYTNGRPASKEFYTGTLVSSIVTISGMPATVTGHHFQRQYSYSYLYDAGNNRNQVNFINYDSHGNVMSNIISETSVFVFSNPAAGLIYNYGSFDNPNPGNLDQDTKLVFSKSTYSPYACQGTTPLATSRLTSTIIMDSSKVDTIYKCLYKLKYTKRDDNSCTENVSNYSVYFSY